MASFPEMPCPLPASRGFYAMGIARTAFNVNIATYHTPAAQ